MVRALNVNLRCVSSEHTLTLSDSMSYSFTGQPAFGPIVTFSASNNITNTGTGAFSLVGGNPYFPGQTGAFLQAAGEGVGVQVPWYSANGGPLQAVGSNRVTFSLPRIFPGRLFPDWSVLPPGGYGPGAGGASGGPATASGGSHAPGNGIDPQSANASTVPGANVGVPPASSDEPNLGLPVGQSGPASVNHGPGGPAFYFGPAYSGSALLPPFQSPQQSPNNGPYQYSFQRTTKSGAGVDCYCGVFVADPAYNPNYFYYREGNLVYRGVPPGGFTEWVPQNPAPAEQAFDLWKGRGGVQPKDDMSGAVERWGHTGQPSSIGNFQSTHWGGTPFQAGREARETIIVGGANVALDTAKVAGQIAGMYVCGPVGLFGNATAGTINLADKDYLGAALDFAALPFVPCFAAGTPLLTPHGAKPIEEFHPGDWIWSSPEDEPEAPPEPKQVEEIFTSRACLWHLKVGGRIIRTTEQHPFYVRGKGWMETRDLTAGDHLRSHDGQWMVVHEVRDSGEDAPVYNLRISDYHTYFVGSETWGFSVWAHNACSKTSGNNRWAKLGKQMHKAYGQLLARFGYKANVKLPNGRFADAVDFSRRIVRELKPNNKNAAARGLRQLRSYILELHKKYGGKWKCFVDVYR